MIFKETLEDGRFHVFSDTYKIIKVGTDEIYDDAVDRIEYMYAETDILLPSEEATEEDYIKALSDLGVKDE